MAHTKSGPGGRVPNQGNPPSAPGVGANSKRSDLERPNTPPLAGSDLQVGDISQLQEGQRIAPIRTQPNAVPPPSSGGGGARPAPATAQAAPDILGVIGDRLGGSLSATPNAPGRQVDQNLRRRGASWINFLTQLTAQPGASPLLKASVQSQLKQQIQANIVQTQGGAIFMRDADEALGFLDG